MLVVLRVKVSPISMGDFLLWVRNAVVRRQIPSTIPADVSVVGTSTILLTGQDPTERRRQVGI